MGLLDKDYSLTVDVRNGSINGSEITLSAMDRNVANIKLYFVRDEVPVNITGFTLVANIQKPDTLKRKVDISISDARNGIGLLDLPTMLTYEVGNYNMEIVMNKDGEVAYSYPFAYKVRETLSGDFEE